MVRQARDHITDCGARAHSPSATHGDAVAAIDYASSAGTVEHLISLHPGCVARDLNVATPACRLQERLAPST